MGLCDWLEGDLATSEDAGGGGWSTQCCTRHWIPDVIFEYLKTEFQGVSVVRRLYITVELEQIVICLSNILLSNDTIVFSFFLKIGKGRPFDFVNPSLSQCGLE